MAAVEASGAVSYFHTDRLGSVVAVSNGAGSASETYAFSPYGETANPVTGNPWRYTGRYLDAETGLYYYRARYYSPRLGQFLQTDPIGSKDDPNLYMYVGLDPANATDPSGMTACNGSRLRTSNGSMCSGSDTDPSYASGEGNIYNRFYEKLKKQLRASNSRGGSFIEARVGPDKVLDLLATLSASALDEQAEIRSNIADHRARGLRGEALARSQLEADGYQILTTQLMVRTSLGVRIIDFVIQRPDGGIAGVEVKKNSATRSKVQLARNLEMFTRGATIVSRNKQGFTYGDEIRIDTGEIVVAGVK